MLSAVEPRSLPTTERGILTIHVADDASREVIRKAARKRMLTVRDLVQQAVDRMIDDDLFDAILDDGV